MVDFNRRLNIRSDLRDENLGLRNQLLQQAVDAGRGPSGSPAIIGGRLVQPGDVEGRNAAVSALNERAEEDRARQRLQGSFGSPDLSLGLREDVNAGIRERRAGLPSLRNFGSFGDEYEDEFGYMGGGVVDKQRKMKQPGYKCSGKVRMPGHMHGGKTGKIGNVSEDDGKDTVEVRTREGEYLLNPETVGFMGGGSYEQGVRVLDDLVRTATGQEPGPVPVNEDGEAMRGFRRGGKMGYANGGSFAWVPGEGRVAYPPPPGGLGDRIDPRFTRDVDLRAVGRSVADAGQRIATAPQTLRAANFLTRGAGYVAPAVEAYQAAAVAADDDATAIDAGTQAAAGAGRLATAGLGAAYGSAFGPVGTLVGGAGGYILGDQAIRAGRRLLGVDEADPIRRGGPVTIDNDTGAVETPAASPNTYYRPFGGGAVDLRDMNVVQRTGGPNGEVIVREDVDGVPTFSNLRQTPQSGDTATLQAQADTRAAEAATRQQASLRNALLASAASNPKAAAEVLTSDGKTKNQVKTDQRIEERFQVPIRDDDGQITGYRNDQPKMTAFRDAMSQLGLDVYGLTEAQQDSLFDEFEPVYEETLRFMNEGARRGLAVPDIPRTTADGTVPQRIPGSNIGLGDVLGPEATLGDYLAGLFDDDPVNDEFVLDPVSGLRIPARRLVRDRNGLEDPRLLVRYGYTPE